MLLKESNTTDSMFLPYKAGLDSATAITLLEKDDKGKNAWILFKVETPITKKYSEPESDLYFVIQGEQAVYEIYVAIEKPSLNEDFIEKWST